jgi:hypothetical protein
VHLPRSAFMGVTRWLAVLVPTLDLLLVLSGVLDPRTGLVVGVVLEVLCAGVAIVEARAFRRVYLRARVAGRSRSEAMARGFAAAWPPVVMTLARAEIGLARSLWWAVRRRREIRPEDVALPYSDRFGVMLWAMCGLGALELGVVHVLTPWPGVRWVLFAVGVYALLWFIGFGFSLRQHPHLVRGDELVLRFGHFRATTVPLHRLASARTHVLGGHARNVVLDGDSLALSVMGDTNVELGFTPPVEVEVTGGRRSLSRISFFVDDPRAATGLLRGRVADRGRQRISGEIGGAG